MTCPLVQIFTLNSIHLTFAMNDYSGVLLGSDKYLFSPLFSKVNSIKSTQFHFESELSETSLTHSCILKENEIPFSINYITGQYSTLQIFALTNDIA